MNELATEKERVEFCWTMSIALDGRLRYFHAAMVDLASIIVVIRRMRLLYVTKYILQRFFPTILNLLFFKDIFCIFFINIQILFKSTWGKWATSLIWAVIAKIKSDLWSFTKYLDNVVEKMLYQKIL